MTIYLPEDLLSEVLCRLPVKSLLRFRSVSKSWLSLISCPDFAKSQFKRASSVPKIMELGWENTFKSLSFDGLPKSQKFQLPFYNGSSRGRILGSVNGLLCVCSSDYDRFFIYNPCTNQYKYIPALTYPRYSQVYYYGFGYDSTADDYKLLIVTLSQRHLEISSIAMISLFSLRKGSWRSFLDTKYFHQCFYGDCWATCFHDAIHWSFTEIRDSVTRSVIVSFELAEESFSISHVPDLCQDSVHLSILDGCLCLSSYRLSRNNLYVLNIWMMKEYGISSSWTKLITLEFPTYIYGFMFPLFLTGHGEIIYKYGMSYLLPVDSQTNCFKIDPGCYGFQGFNQIVHVETLISPNVLKST